MRTNKRYYENLIIGFGKAGKTLAAYLAKNGKKVALIEQSINMYGGACINIACIPTKSLITSAENDHSYAKAFMRKNEITSLLRKKNFETLDDLSLVTVLTGKASFISPHEVNVKLLQDGEEIAISATNIFINTGSQPFIPVIEGIQTSTKVFTSTTLMEKPVLPEKLIIIGVGYIGLEFADMYAKFGTEVTLLDNGDTFLPNEDGDIADEIFKVLSEKKIKIIRNASVEKIADISKNAVSVQYKDKEENMIELEAAAVLVATGRKPYTEGLNLSAIGIETDERGYIQVDEFLRTNVPNIWALGDINGSPQFTGPNPLVEAMPFRARL